MQVEYTPKVQFVLFKSLQLGDNFIYNNEVWMKMRAIYVEEFDSYDNDVQFIYNAVNMVTGGNMCVSDNSHVLPIKLKLVQDDDANEFLSCKARSDEP